MSFISIALGSGIGALGAGAVAGGLTAGGGALIGGSLGLGVGSALASQRSSNKAIDAQQKAAQASQIDIDRLNEQTKAIARQNALDSAELERQLTPEVPQLRTEANNAILNSLRDPSLALAQGTLRGQMGNNVPNIQSPLLQAAIAKAQANLGLGGQIPLDAQNAATRHAIATAGTVAPGNLGLGRDLVARDLGLTSLQLEQQRLQNASQLGGQEMQLGGLNAGINQFNSQNLLARLQMLQSINNQQFSQGITAGAFGQGINQPLVGLDPTAVGNIAMANAGNMSGAGSNLANIYGAQGQGQQNLLGNSLGIMALLNMNNRTPATNPYVPTSTVYNPGSGSLTYTGPGGAPTPYFSNITGYGPGS